LTFAATWQIAKPECNHARPPPDDWAFLPFIFEKLVMIGLERLVALR
jgi:hypothetical protein